MRPHVRARVLFGRKPLFTVTEAAAYLGLGETTVRRRIAGGHLAAHPWGQRRLIFRADLDRFLQSQGREMAPGSPRSVRAAGRAGKAYFGATTA